ncbi:MAG: hypothetical protein H0T42_16215 [Deltaproteobacteria bacterium]|nr:hypothetical protein [Deltaproteobacteria bacterium]
MRDQQDHKQTRENRSEQPNRQQNERKQRLDTLNGSDADEPQICRGMD